MADSKLSALTAITGANTATGDLFYIDDVSVTTSKSITRAELAIALQGEAKTLTNTTFSVAGTGNAFSMTPITNSLSGDVALNNASNYFTGPTIAQGTSGTWFASGTVTVLVGGSSGTVLAKLWDGTTVIASGRGVVTSSVNYVSISLSGYLASPADNIRISVKSSDTSAVIAYNATGESKDSTVSAIRIA